MEKRRKIQAVNGEFQLSKAIIQHIQSFLSRKQAAQTSILSKSWYGAWLTCPNLDLDQRDFPKNRGCWNPNPSIIDNRFSEFAKKTMQRYEELNLKIESFKLCMQSTNPDSCTLANELIVKAMKMGVTNFSFKFLSRGVTFVLPHEVLASETLVRLSLRECQINLGADGKVSCSRLKSLSLHRVYFNGDVIWDIISSCPLIKKLSLSNCVGLVVLRPYIFAKQNVGSAVYEFHKLMRLLLVNVSIKPPFFREFSSKFPCLKDLTLRYCEGYKGIRISSSSLECISFAQHTKLRAKFDVPSILKFHFSGSVLPSLSFKTTSREWESNISISCHRASTSGFLKLKSFLRELSLSKISLSVNIRSIVKKSVDYTGDVQGFHRPVVENLTMVENLTKDTPSSVCSAFLDGLLWSCRPMFITQYWFPKSWIANGDLLELLCKALVQVSENCCIPNRNTCGLHDLEEVNAELFEESLAEWRPLPWKTLLDASASPKNERKVRFQLRWGLEHITFK